MKLSRLIVCLLVGGALFAAKPTWAGLGGKDDTIEKDRSFFQGVRGQPQVHAAYVVHQITNDSTVVREFVSRSSGKVFGVSWKGPNHPDLTGLLGPYADDLKKILQRPSPRLYRTSHQVFQNDNLVVEKSGHMGSMRGRAYVPSLIPESMDANEIQ